MKRILYYAISGIVCLAACTSEETDYSGKRVRLKSHTTPDTRTAMYDAGNTTRKWSLTWEKGDEVNLLLLTAENGAYGITPTSEMEPSFKKYTAESANGTGSALGDQSASVFFDGNHYWAESPTATHYFWAIYPYQEAGEVSIETNPDSGEKYLANTPFTVSLPNTRTQVVPSDYSYGAMEASALRHISKDLVMVGHSTALIEAQASVPLVFRPISCILKLNVASYGAIDPFCIESIQLTTDESFTRYLAYKEAKIYPFYSYFFDPADEGYEGFTTGSYLFGGLVIEHSDGIANTTVYVKSGDPDDPDDNEVPVPHFSTEGSINAWFPVYFVLPSEGYFTGSCRLQVVIRARKVSNPTETVVYGVPLAESMTSCGKMYTATIHVSPDGISTKFENLEGVDITSMPRKTEGS